MSGSAVSGASAAPGYHLDFEWGSDGSGDGQFDSPQGIAVDSNANVYVADNDNSRIQKFTSAGGFLTKWGSYGAGVGEFYNPRSVAVGAGGNVYVTDGSALRIQTFTSTGVFDFQWALSSPAFSVATDPAGNVYVANNSNDRIQKFDSAGNFLTKWGGLNGFSSITTDPAGNVYVLDVNAQVLRKYTSEGTSSPSGVGAVPDRSSPFRWEWARIRSATSTSRTPSTTGSRSSRHRYIHHPDSTSQQGIGPCCQFVGPRDVAIGPGRRPVRGDQRPTTDVQVLRAGPQLPGRAPSSEARGPDRRHRRAGPADPGEERQLRLDRDHRLGRLAGPAVEIVGGNSCEGAHGGPAAELLDPGPVQPTVGRCIYSRP